MNQDQDYYLDLSQVQQNCEELFEYDYPLQVKQPKIVEEDEEEDENDRIDEEEDENDRIDEELLAKTSKLHQALRNKKLLEFEVMEARIMKKGNFKKCGELEE